MYMKKFTVLLLLLSSGHILADYNEPPGWNDCNSFTHQSWDFLNDNWTNGIVQPLPDGDPCWINPFGQPQFTEISFTDEAFGGYYWEYSTPDFSTSRRGFYGGMTDVSLTFSIPNSDIADSNWTSQVWLQETVFARKDGGQTHLLEIARDDQFTDTNNINLSWLFVEDINEPEGNTAKWVRATAIYDFNDRPPMQFVRVTAYKNPAPFHAAMIDQVDIDTRLRNIADIEGVGDGKVNMIDFSELAAGWNSNDPNTDLDNNGIVDNNDLKRFSQNWLIGTD